MLMSPGLEARGIGVSKVRGTYLRTDLEGLLGCFFGAEYLPVQRLSVGKPHIRVEEELMVLTAVCGLVIVLFMNCISRNVSVS